MTDWKHSPGEDVWYPTGAAGSAGAAGSCWVEFSGTWPPKPGAP